MEILYRCHLSPVVPILRRQWFSTIADSVDQDNALALPQHGVVVWSLPDSATSLQMAPWTLAQEYREVEQAVAGNLNYILCCSELEHELIHFSHGSLRR